jgi:putative membrane protein
MKKLSYAIMIAAAAYSFQSCNNAPKDAKANADSLNKTKDTTGVTDTTKKDTMAMKSGGAMAVDADDAKFATAAANGGLAEVALGKLASQKSTNDQVKNFAEMMVKDHSKANDELMAIAKTKNITLPAAPDADHQKKMDDLSKLSGKDFDKAYVDAMVDGHKKTLSLMQDAAKNCKDADLKAFAAKTAPVVQMHLDAINKIHDSLK